MEELQNKLRIRSSIMAKVGNSKWGLENRILTTTAHALLESLVNYGLTVTGSAATVRDFDMIDTKILNPIARRIAGVGYTIRREILYTLADLRAVRNHYLLKTANVFDRMLRTGNTQAEKNLQKYLEEEKWGQDIWRPEQQFQQLEERVEDVGESGEKVKEIRREDRSKRARDKQNIDGGYRERN